MGFDTKRKAAACEQPTIEPFRTMREVADITQLPYYQIVRAVKAGLIPHHRLGTSSKKYLRMSEVLAAVMQHGGET